jgi:hypothetical protein
MNVVEGRPHFLHQIFAEYFTASWFSKNFVPNRTVLEVVLFAPASGIIRKVFDRILAKGRRLCSAVLNCDAEAVETLLQEGSDVNAVDRGGRTALHLTAAQGPGDRLWKDITNSLLRCGATVDTKDTVLDWTPLQYATKSGNDFVEQELILVMQVK